MLFWLGVIILIIISCIYVEVTNGNRQIYKLTDIAPVSNINAPEVSIIVAARNEERNIRVALLSLLEIDYPNLQLIVVNDRSEDRTAEILKELVEKDTRLKVVHITELPPGWLGKNHALWQGAHQAKGELLLFTDADVVMAPDTLRKAVSYFMANKLDHLAASPDAKMPGLLLNMFGVTFGIFFCIFTRPWKAREKSSYWHIGIGAFNLVRAKCYRKVGGHQAIALRPDDDLKLGKLLKKNGYQQDMVNASHMIEVEWYSSVSELLVGLEKNIYAGTDYRLWFATAGVLFNTLVFLWPYLAVFVTTGSTQVAYIGCVILLSLLVAGSAKAYGRSAWYALGFPITAALFNFIIVRTLIINLTSGGINWRGTFYSLEELKKNRI